MNTFIFEKIFRKKKKMLYKKKRFFQFDTVIRSGLSPRNSKAKVLSLSYQIFRCYTFDVDSRSTTCEEAFDFPRFYYTFN